MRSLLPTPAALFAVVGLVSLLWTREASACANAMKGGGLSDDAKAVLMLLGTSLLGVMFFVGLYLRSQAKERAERAERFGDLDGEA